MLTYVNATEDTVMVIIGVPLRDVPAVMERGWMNDVRLALEASGLQHLADRPLSQVQIGVMIAETEADLAKRLGAATGGDPTGVLDAIAVQQETEEPAGVRMTADGRWERTAWRA